MARAGVFSCFSTVTLWHVYEAYRAEGVVFVREPREESYDTVAVFRELYGNLWDLLEPRGSPDAGGVYNR